MENWHLDKKVNVGHIISTAILSISIFVYVNKLENQINKNAINIDTMKELRKEDARRVEKSLDKINFKLDKLLGK